MSSIPIGKLPPGLLQVQLSKISIDDPRILVPPRVGEDCTVIKTTGRCLVATTDPITFTARRIGWYGVHVNANDVAVMGAQPLYFLATVLLSEAAGEGQVDEIFNDILAACEQVGATLCGGHIEITAGLPRTMMVGMMLGEVSEERLVIKDAIRAGDDIILTKWAGLEGTAILATEKRDELAAEVPAEALDRAAELIYEPGISVVKDALSACEAVEPGAIHGMHDPTEGGVATALHELIAAATRASGKERQEAAPGANRGRARGEGQQYGALVEYSTIPVRDDTRRFCEIFGLDPLGIISSGALLIACDPHVTGAVLKALHHAGVSAVRIGAITPEPGIRLLKDGKEIPMPRYDSDELSKVL